MTGRGQAERRAHPARPAGALLAGCVVALLVAVTWPLARPALPLLPTDDLYTHLSVTRHLARGEGFRCDIAYPLSFAWPFARELPQPLVHRPPAWPVALLLPYAVAGGDPEASVGAVRGLQVLLLAVILGLGTTAWWRRGRPGAATAWLAAAIACPLWRYAVDWGLTEVPAALLLLAMWLRHRDGARAPGAADGALLGALALLRPELAWLPVAWWLAWRQRPTVPSAAAAATGGLRAWAKRPLAALLVLAALTLPWAVRNLRLAGDPWFNVQAQAELVKDTRTWPGYDVYRQLEPQPAWRVLADDPVPVARKFARGARFYAQSWPGLIAWPVALILVITIFEGWRAATGPQRRARAQLARATREPATVALGSAVTLALLYALFDHSLRHLLPIVPILAWEAGPWLGEWPWRRLRGQAAPPRAAMAVLLALAVAAPAVFLTVRQPAGWRASADEAVATQPAARAEAARLRAATPGEVLFVETAAAPWLADRSAVWSPLSDTVAARIRAWLTAPTAPEARP